MGVAERLSGIPTLLICKPDGTGTLCVKYRVQLCCS